MNLKTAICLLVLLMSSGISVAGVRYLQGGIGNFEGFNIGFYHSIGKEHICYGYGNDLNLYGQGFYNCIYFGAGRNILQKSAWAFHRLSADLRFNIWNLENKSNVFSAVSFIPELHYTLPLKSKYNLRFYAGYAYSSVFRYKRKGYYEVGWPDEWMPNFGLTLQYLLP